MISEIIQPIEKIGEPGANRTRDNLIKSLILCFVNHRLVRFLIVKPLTTRQYVIRFLSNLFRDDKSYDKHNDPIGITMASVK